ncbi:unnamed protein product [Rhizopus stolonifer]
MEIATTTIAVCGFIGFAVYKVYKYLKRYFGWENSRMNDANDFRSNSQPNHDVQRYNEQSYYIRSYNDNTSIEEHEDNSDGVDDRTSVKEHRDDSDRGNDSLGDEENDSDNQNNNVSEGNKQNIVESKDDEQSINESDNQSDDNESSSYTRVNEWLKSCGLRKRISIQNDETLKNYLNYVNMFA